MNDTSFYYGILFELEKIGREVGNTNNPAQTPASPAGNGIDNIPPAGNTAAAADSGVNAIHPNDPPPNHSHGLGYNLGAAGGLAANFVNKTTLLPVRSAVNFASKGFINSKINNFNPLHPQNSSSVPDAVKGFVRGFPEVGQDVNKTLGDKTYNTTQYNPESENVEFKPQNFNFGRAVDDLGHWVGQHPGMAIGGGLGLAGVLSMLFRGNSSQQSPIVNNYYGSQPNKGGQPYKGPQFLGTEPQTETV